MPDAAFKATEHQFVSLLNAASEGFEIELLLYTLPCIARTETIARAAARHYSSVDGLWDAGLDALIVTGKEPVSADLRDEPCWQMMTRILEWARENTHSTVWSCLAAHAAVLHMDNIPRRRSSDKDFGVFECERRSILCWQALRRDSMFLTPAGTALVGKNWRRAVTACWRAPLTPHQTHL